VLVGQKKAVAIAARNMKQAATNAPAAKCTAPTGNATTNAAPPAAPTVATCLTKEYIDNGAVKFRDTCTGEWAQQPASHFQKFTNPGGVTAPSDQQRSKSPLAAP
jgi:hypothetical protein